LVVLNILKDVSKTAMETGKNFKDAVTGDDGKIVELVNIR